MKTIKTLLAIIPTLIFTPPAGAQGFGDEKTVWEETNWLFEGFTRSGSVTEFQSLYVRGITPRASNTTSEIKFADGTIINTSGDSTKMLNIPSPLEGAENITATTSAATSASINNCIAINILRPGTLYIRTRVPSTNNVEEQVAYQLDLYFNGEIVMSQTGTRSTSNQNLNITYSNKVSGTYYFGGNVAQYILGIRFVPATEEYVGATTLWKFSQYYNWNNTAHVPVTLQDGTGIINYDGLYLHTSGSSGSNIVTGVQNSNYTIDGTDISINSPVVRLQFSKGSGTVGTGTAGATKNIDGIAFNAACPGTVYVLARGTAYTTGDSRYLWLYFNGDLKKEQLYTTADFYTLSYTSDTDGTFYFKGSTSNWSIAAVLFVPTNEAIMYKPVEIGATGWATFSASQNYTIPEGLKALYVTGYDHENMSVTLQETATIPANTGVLLQGTPNTTYLLTSTGTSTNLTTSLSVANIGPFTLPQTSVNRINSSTTQAVTNFILVAEGTEAKFGRSKGSGTLAGNKAFLQIPTASLSSDAKLSLGYSSDVTGIEDVKDVRGEEVKRQSNAVYTLDGRKLSTLNSQLSTLPKGIYIVNGKKVVLR